jgi:hypothetical protein
MTTGTITTKANFTSMVKKEIADARKRRQSKLWVYWSQEHNRMRLLDTQAELKITERELEKQGLIKNQSLCTKVDNTAKEFGVASVRRNIYAFTENVFGIPVSQLPADCHVYKTKGIDLSGDPISAFFAERINAYNEFVLIEISI